MRQRAKFISFLFLTALVSFSLFGQTARKDILNYTQAEQDSLIMSVVRKAMEGNAMRASGTPQRSAPASLWTYDVGSIPYSEDVTPTGARTVTVPIATAPTTGLAPSVSLTYNSQAGNDLAGYGWSIGGLSKITVVPKTAYYDGTALGANIYDANSVYMLDGNRLVTNTDSVHPDYHYETASGHILVKKHFYNGSTVSYFTALYPDGSRVKFGDSGSTYYSAEFPVTEIEDRDGNRTEFQYYYEYSIKYEADNLPGYDRSDLTPLPKIDRPDILGYDPRVSNQIDVHHNFPRMFDEVMVKYGLGEYNLRNNSYWYSLPGTINGERGMYTIGINKDGIIYHRFFFSR